MNAKCNIQGLFCLEASAGATLGIEVPLLIPPTFRNMYTNQNFQSVFALLQAALPICNMYTNQSFQ